MNAAIRYIAEAAAGTIGAVVLGEALASPVDRAVPALGGILEEPVFLGPICIALILGCAVTLKFGYRRSSIWVWAAGLLVFILFLGDWMTSIRAHHWTRVWDNFFGRDCNDSECLYELIATAPFYTSLAYSIAAAICGALRSKRPSSVPDVA